jgi:hypothetical protein
LGFLCVMNDRPNDLRRIRPQIGSIKSFDLMGDEEKFQNITLRPILKLQNPLLLEVFQNYIVNHKGVFFELSTEKRLAYIENTIFKNQKFRNALKGIIIGHFTVEEYKEYTLQSSSINKRMMNMVVERLKDQVEYFEPLAS